MHSRDSQIHTDPFLQSLSLLFLRVDTHVSPKPLCWKALPSGLKELELFFPWGGRLVFGGFLGREVQGNFLSVPSLSSQILQVRALTLAL